MKKKVEQRKNRPAPTSSTSEDSTEPKFQGCAVPDPIICSMQKTDVSDDDGVVMTCTNEACQIDKTIHRACFDLFEKSLVQRLGSMGSARGWTISQRQNNLWEKKGWGLIGKYCRCHCGHGLMALDKVAVYEKQKALQKQKKLKKHKASALPQLQFVSKASAYTAEDIEKKRMDSPQNTSSRSRNFSEMSNCSIRSGATFTIHENSVYGESNGKYRNSDFTLPSDDEEEVIPAPMPPKQSRSYASTIRAEMDGAKKSMSLNEIHEDSGFESSHLMHCNNKDEIDLITEYEEQNEDEYEEQPQHNNEHFGFISPISYDPMTSAPWTERYDPSKSMDQLRRVTPTMLLAHPPGLAPPIPPPPPQRSLITGVLTSTPRTTRKNGIRSMMMAASSFGDEIGERKRSFIEFAAQPPIRSFFDTDKIDAMMMGDREYIEPIDSSAYNWNVWTGQGFNIGEKLKYMP